MFRSVVVAGAAASCALLTSGAGRAAAQSDGGLSVPDISVVVGSGVHTEDITVRPDSPAIGVPYSLLIWSYASDFLGEPEPSTATNATCAKGAEGTVYANLPYVWTCTSSSAGWGAGTIAISVNITESGLQGTSPGCLAGGCEIQMVAGWTAPVGGTRGSIAIVPAPGMTPFSPTSPATSDSTTATTVQATPSAARPSAALTAPSAGMAAPAATSAASSAIATGSGAAPTSSTPASAASSSGTEAAASGTHSAPLDAAPTGGGDGAASASLQLWALLGALCIVVGGVTSAVLVGKGKHRA